MNRIRPFIHGTCSVLALFVLHAAAPAGDDFDLSWHTIDGGGGTSTGGDLSLSGTMGQPDAGVMSNGPFTLVGGFWALGGGASKPCPQDISPEGGDGIIGPADLAELLASWGQCPGCPADFDQTDAVGPPDLAAILAAWGPC
jgi:hypothetical protein